MILVQVMRAFGLDEVEVSEHDILHGAALSAGFGPGLTSRSPGLITAFLAIGEASCAVLAPIFK